MRDVVQPKPHPLPPMRGFGGLVRARRRQLGLTQRQLSQAVACAEITLRKIEAGERLASPQLALLLADTLQLEGGERERYMSAALVQTVRAPKRATRLRAPAAGIHANEVEPLAASVFVSYNDEASRALLTRLNDGIETIRAVLGERIQRDPQGALRLSGLLVEFWLKRNLLGEGRGWCEHALLQDAAPTPNRALALLAAGVMAGYQSDYTHAELRLDECLAIAPAASPVAAAITLIRPYARHILGWLAVHHAHSRDDALAQLSAAAADYERIGQPLRAAHVRCDMALAYAYCGETSDVPASVAQATSALNAYQAANNTFGIAFALGMIAEAYLAVDQAGAAAQAEPYARQSLAVSLEADYEHDIAWAYSRLSEICRLQNKLDEARRLAEEALPLFQKMGDRRAICYRLQGLAQIARARGDVAEARRRLAASLSLAHELHNRPTVMRAFSELIAIALDAGHLLDASTLQGALDTRREFLSDALSRAACAALDARIAGACAALAARDSASLIAARERGAAMNLRGLIAWVLER